MIWAQAGARGRPSSARPHFGCRARVCQLWRALPLPGLSMFDEPLVNVADGRVARVTPDEGIVQCGSAADRLGRAPSRKGASFSFGRKPVSGRKSLNGRESPNGRSASPPRWVPRVGGGWRRESSTVLKIKPKEGDEEEKTMEKVKMRLGTSEGWASRFMIDPREAKRMWMWDTITGVFLIFVALVTPFEVGYLQPTTSWLDPLFLVNQVVNAVFLADLVLQFFLMVPVTDKEGTRFVSNPSRIAKVYLRGWFTIDVLSIAGERRFIISNKQHSDARSITSLDAVPRSCPQTGLRLRLSPPSPQSPRSITSPSPPEARLVGSKTFGRCACCVRCD